MVRQEVTVKDFSRIAKENEYFLWHFLQKEQEESAIIMWSIFKEKGLVNNQKSENEMKLVLDKINIPYFESYVEDSIDFLMDMGLDGKQIWTPTKHKSWFIDKKRYFNPIVVGFRRNKIITSTFEKGHCYCHQGVIELIGKLNPEFLLNSNLE